MLIKELHIIDTDSGLNTEELPIHTLRLVHSGGQRDFVIYIQAGHTVTDQQRYVKGLAFFKIEIHKGLGIGVKQVLSIVELDPAFLDIE